MLDDAIPRKGETVPIKYRRVGGGCVLVSSVYLSSEVGVEYDDSMEVV